jgi:parallel beta-helix repeat protein
MRGGSQCLIEDNRIFDCLGGIRLSGTKHVVRNNLIVSSSRTGIRLLYGMTREQGGHYQAAGECVIERNTIVDAGQVRILVGDGRDDDWGDKGLRNVPPEGNRIFDNAISGKAGDLLFADAAPNNEIEGNFFYRSRDARISDPGSNAAFGSLVFRDPDSRDFRLNRSRSAEQALSKGAHLDPPRN